MRDRMHFKKVETRSGGWLRAGDMAKLRTGEVGRVLDLYRDDGPIYALVEFVDGLPGVVDADLLDPVDVVTALGSLNDEPE